MGRALKWIGILLLLVVVLLVAAAVAIRYLVDPNDYRDQIAAAVEARTGRQLTLAGELSLSFLPLGIEINGATLGNAAGFGSEPFARIKRAVVGVQLMPLLDKRLELNTIILDGLYLNLSRHKDGSTNWQDLAGGGKEESPAPESGDGGKQALGALSIAGVKVQEGSIIWDDQMGGQRIELSALSLLVGTVVPGKPVDIELALDYRLNQELSGHFEMGTTATVDLATKRLTLHKFSSAARAAGAAIPGGQAQLVMAVNDLLADLEGPQVNLQGLHLESYGMRLSGDLTGTGGDLKANGKLLWEVVDAQQAAPLIPPALAKGSRLELPLALAGETLTAAPLNGNIAGAKLNGELKVTGLLSAPKATGAIAVGQFSPRDLLAVLGVALQTADPQALASATLSTHFEASPGKAALEQLKLTLDDSTLTGRVGLPSFSGPTLRFDLAVDQLVVDRYMPPQAQAAARAPGFQWIATAHAEEAKGGLPVDLLRSLDARGELKIARLTAMNLRSEQVRVVVTSSQGRLRLSPVSANLYGGSYLGNIGLDVTQAQPRYSLDERLTGVQAEPLLKDLQGDAPITGTATVAIKATAAGEQPDAITRSLNGSGSFEFRNGSVNGVNIALSIRRALAAAQGQPQPPNEALSTDFAELAGTLRIDNGVVHNNDLQGKSPLLRIDGDGLVDLPQKQLDYGLTVALVGSLKGQGGQALDDLRNLPIPVRIEGPFEKPEVSVDIKKLLESKGKAALEQELRKRLGIQEQPAAGSAPAEGTAAPTEKPEKQLEQQLKEKVFQELFKR